MFKFASTFGMFGWIDAFLPLNKIHVRNIDVQFVVGVFEPADESHGGQPQRNVNQKMAQTTSNHQQLEMAVHCFRGNFAKIQIFSDWSRMVSICH